VGERFQYHLLGTESNAKAEVQPVAEHVQITSEAMGNTLQIGVGSKNFHHILMSTTKAMYINRKIVFSSEPPSLMGKPYWVSHTILARRKSLPHLLLK
jgi:hypothetical protein